MISLRAEDGAPRLDRFLADRFPEIPRARFARAVQLIEPDGQVYEAAEAIFRALAHAPEHRWPLWAYRFIPAFARTAEIAYRLVAAHRGFFSRVTRQL